uniref:DNA-directed RNA polymerase n=1 Tax=Pleodorina starrii TaxID=330485 RepID=M9P808_9CHLO|nr:beta' subunit of RNA polymerase [Pleodorina starrii]AFY64436.1 beta' subunit of RNA polymerase [Pleodorina starrii]
MIISYVIYKKHKTNYDSLTLLYNNARNLPKNQSNNKFQCGSIPNSLRKSPVLLHLGCAIKGNFVANISYYCKLSFIYPKPKLLQYTAYFNKKQTPPFFNFTFDKGRLKNLVSWTLENYGQYKTVELLEQLKKTGFEYATKAGISLGIDDLKIPSKKNTLLLEAEQLTKLTVHQYQRADITAVERFQRLIDTWHRTSEQLKQEVINYFEETDILNPVYMMAFSGARGNISQVRQLVGMRGLMSDPQGQIIDFPIRSNFREGLTLTEYIISSYGARKGIVDTALRTANAGYLTRRLVDVAQHVIISHYDCGTQKGIFLTDMKEGNKTIVSAQNRIIGRVLARDIYKPNTNIKVASRNQEISTDLAFEITKITNRIFVRSALTCNTTKLLCQLCYGWSLAQGNLVSVGEAVGVIAAQSIGEPGTQLTMRTFHTGGVFSGDVSDEIRAPYNGFVYYEKSIPGILIRALDGKILFLTKSDGTLIFTTNRILNSNKNSLPIDWSDKLKIGQHVSVNLDIKKYKIPAYTVLFIRNGESVFQKQVVAQITSIKTKPNMRDTAELVIKSELEGLFYAKKLQVQKKVIGPKAKFVGEAKQNLLLDAKAMEIVVKARGWNFAWVLSGKRYELPLLLKSFAIIGDYVTPQTVITRHNFKFPNYYKLKLNITTKACPKDLQMLGNSVPFYFGRQTNIFDRITNHLQNNKQIDANTTTPNSLFFSVDTKAKHFRLCNDRPKSILTLKKVKLFNLFTKYTKKAKSSLQSRFQLRNKHKTNLVFNFFSKNSIRAMEFTKIGKYVYRKKKQERAKTIKTHNHTFNSISRNYLNLVCEQKKIKATPKVSSSEKQLTFNNIARIQTTKQKIKLKQDLLFLNLKKIKYHKIGYFHFFNSQNPFSSLCNSQNKIFRPNILLLQRVIKLTNGHQNDKIRQNNIVIDDNQNKKNTFEQKHHLLKFAKAIKFNYNIDYNEVMLAPTSLNSEANLTKAIALKRFQSSNYLLEWFSSKTIFDPKAFFCSSVFLFCKTSFVKTLESIQKKKQEFNLNNRQQASQYRRDLQLTQLTNNIEQNQNFSQVTSQKFKSILAENKLKTYKNIYKKSKEIFIKDIGTASIGSSISTPLFQKKEKNKLYYKQQTSLQTLVFNLWFKNYKFLWNKQRKKARFQIKRKIDCYLNNLTKNIFCFDKYLNHAVQKSKQQTKSINKTLDPYYIRNRVVRRGERYLYIKKAGIISSDRLFFEKKSSNLFLNKTLINSSNEKSFFTVNKNQLTFWNKKIQTKKHFILNSKIPNYIENIYQFLPALSAKKKNYINKTFIFEYFKFAQKKDGTNQILKHFKSTNLIKTNFKTKKNSGLLPRLQTKNLVYTQRPYLTSSSQEKRTKLQKQNRCKLKQVGVTSSLTHIFYTNLHKNKITLLNNFFKHKIKIKKALILNKKLKVTNKHIRYIYVYYQSTLSKNALILLLLDFIKTLYVSYNYISPNFIQKKIQKPNLRKPQFQGSFPPLRGTPILGSVVTKSFYQNSASVQAFLSPTILFGNITGVNKRIKKALSKQIIYIVKKECNNNVIGVKKHHSLRILKAFYNTANVMNEISRKANIIPDKAKWVSGCPFFNRFELYNLKQKTTTWVYKILSEKLTKIPRNGISRKTNFLSVSLLTNFLSLGHFILNNILFDKNKINSSFMKKLRSNKRNQTSPVKFAVLRKAIANQNLFMYNQHQSTTKKIRNQSHNQSKTMTCFSELDKIDHLLTIEKYKKNLIWIKNKKPRFLPKEFLIKFAKSEQNDNVVPTHKINSGITQQMIVNDLPIFKNPITRAHLINLNNNKLVKISDKTNKLTSQNHKTDTCNVNLLSYFVKFINKKHRLTLNDLKKIKKEYEKVKKTNQFLSRQLSSQYLFFTQVHQISPYVVNTSKKLGLPFKVNKKQLKDEEKLFGNIKNKTVTGMSETYGKNYKTANILGPGVRNFEESNIMLRGTKDKINACAMKIVNNVVNKKFYNKFIKLAKNTNNNKLQLNKYLNFVLCACTVKVQNPSEKIFLDLDIFLRKNNTKLRVIPSLSNVIKSISIKNKLTKNMPASTIFELFKNRDWNKLVNLINVHSQKTVFTAQPVFMVYKNQKNKVFITTKNSTKIPKKKKPKMGTCNVRFFDRHIYITINQTVNRYELINKGQKQKKDVNLFAKKPNFALIINSYKISKKSKNKEEKNQYNIKRRITNGQNNKLANVRISVTNKAGRKYKKYLGKNKSWAKHLISYNKPPFFDLYFKNPSYCFTYTEKAHKEKTLISKFKNKSKKLLLIPKQPCLNICFYSKYSSYLNAKVFTTHLDKNLALAKENFIRLDSQYNMERFSSRKFFANISDRKTQLKCGISFNYYKDNIVGRKTYFSPFEGELVYTKTYKNYLDLNPYENLKTGLMHLNNLTQQKTKEENMRMAMFKYYLKTINKLPNQKTGRQKAWSRFNLILTKKDLITLNYNQNFEKTMTVFSEIQKIHTFQKLLRFYQQHVSRFTSAVKTKFNKVDNTASSGKIKPLETALMESKNVLSNNYKGFLNSENLRKSTVTYSQACINKFFQAYIKNNLKVQTLAELNKQNLFNKSCNFNLKNKWLQQNFIDCNNKLVSLTNVRSLNKFVSYKQHCLVNSEQEQERSLRYRTTNVVTCDIGMSQSQLHDKSNQSKTKNYNIKIWLRYDALNLNTNIKAQTTVDKHKEAKMWPSMSVTPQAKQILYIPYTSKFNFKWVNFIQKNVFTKNKVGFFFLKGNTFFNTSSKLTCTNIFLNSKIYDLNSKKVFVFDCVDILQDTRYLDLQICLELQKLHLNKNFLKLKPLLDKLTFKNFTYYKNQTYYLVSRQNKKHSFSKKQLYYTMYKSQHMGFLNACTVPVANKIDQWCAKPFYGNKSLVFLPYQQVLFYSFKPINTTTSVYIYQEIFVCNYRQELYLSTQKITRKIKYFDTTCCDFIKLISKMRNLSLLFINLVKIVINPKKNYCVSIGVKVKFLNNWQKILFLSDGKKQKQIAESVQVLKKSGQLIHMNKQKITLRLGQPLVISPRSIIHASHGDFIRYKTSVITLTYQQLKTGDIVQGIPKVEQLFEARTTKRGRLFRDNVTNLLTGLFLKYFVKSAYLLRKNMLDISKKTNITYTQNLQTKQTILKQNPKSHLFVNNKQNQTIILALALHWSVKQSFYKIQQIIVDGILRVYRSQGVSIADKHVEIIVKQMTSKVRIINPNASKLTDYSFSLQNINRGLYVEDYEQKLSYKHTTQARKTKQTILHKRKNINKTRKRQKPNQAFETKLLEQLLSNNLDGPSGLFPGEIVDIDFVENINIFLFKTSSFEGNLILLNYKSLNAQNQATFAIEPIKYEPIVLGITRASLEVESFLSAASFQQTTRVLSQAALYKKKDFLKGLKENIIIGNLIPAGTGYLSSLNVTDS